VRDPCDVADLTAGGYDRDRASPVARLLGTARHVEAGGVAMRVELDVAAGPVAGCTHVEVVPVRVG
jgi:hypothetical protein